ncbi:haloacid dehalogenase-like hydrolase [Qipengyuania sp. GH38]|uniref:HAD family hydrolase n=1 Tax=Qipengyuania intermedia TaxID=2867244 RepID=UPI001C86A01F|nr:haloacid dehalogenase-like hydrolase [Qipengyuania intermedia]
MHIAIYDLDRTLTRRPTFTPFLAFAARRIAPWRLGFMPVWIAAMIGYRMGFYSRTALKRFGMKLMLGNTGLDRLEEIGEDYAGARIRHPGLMPAVMKLVEEDRNSGAQMMVATAAFGFYAQAFATRLGFEHLIATRWDGSQIPGGNCYGEVKKGRVLAWFAEQAIDRNAAHVRFLSDSFADAPLLDWADEPLFVTGSPAEAAKARARGWKVIDPLVP